MQKLLCEIYLLVFLTLGASEHLYSQKNNAAQNQQYILFPDSAYKNLIEYYDAHNTDVLQENLYLRIIAKIESHTYKKESTLPETQFQFLQSTLKYYPEATLNGELLVIPYPREKLENLKEIRYRIPENFFSEVNTTVSLQPEVKLHHNPDKSTLMFNDAYILTFYRSPGTISDALQESRQALQKIFNLILPNAQNAEPDVTLYLTGILFFKGYQSHTVTLNSAGQFYLFLDELREEGSLYFYPSGIDMLPNNIVINGLLYVIKDDILDIYHFAELSITFTRTAIPDYSKIDIKFYPYIKNFRTTNE